MVNKIYSSSLVSKSTLFQKKKKKLFEKEDKEHSSYQTSENLKFTECLWNNNMKILGKFKKNYQRKRKTWDIINYGAQHV